MSLVDNTMRKVPEITLIFWVTKLLTTAMGEATSDFLVAKINPYVAVSIAGLALLTALCLQFVARRYVAWRYWLSVSMVAVFGTMAADGLHVQLGVPYAVSTALFGVILGIVFVLWHKSEGTLSIHSLSTPRREVFYWLTVLATFALGTAAGDLSASTLGLGYLSSGFLFMGLIALPAIGYWLLGLNEILAFWLAYILTRPLGASFADWMSKSHVVGGLGWGDGHVAISLALIIIMGVFYMSFGGRERKLEHSSRSSTT
jgi:uncharacterized membrane-anchored protein